MGHQSALGTCPPSVAGGVSSIGCWGVSSIGCWGVSSIGCWGRVLHHIHQEHLLETQRLQGRRPYLGRNHS